MSSAKSDDKLFELITAFVDGEASPEEILTLEKLRRNSKSIDQAIDAEIQIRQAIREKCRKIHAPMHLRSKCMELLKSENESKSISNQLPIENKQAYQIPIHRLESSKKQPSTDKVTRKRYLKWMVAATILFSVGFISGQINSTFQNDATNTSSYAYEVEDLVQRHFALASDTELFEMSSIHSPNEVERYLNAQMGFELTVPELENATFIGAEMTEFVPGYTTPLLKYSVVGQDDPIHIFAFPIDKMDGDVRLIRDIEAIKKCKSESDTYIKDIKGKHIVSWKWGNVWYVGVSNHHGEVLASMLPTVK